MAYILIASSKKTEKAKQKNFTETFPLEPCFSLLEFQRYRSLQSSNYITETETKFKTKVMKVGKYRGDLNGILLPQSKNSFYLWKYNGPNKPLLND